MDERVERLEGEEERGERGEEGRRRRIRAVEKFRGVIRSMKRAKCCKRKEGFFVCRSGEEAVRPRLRELAGRKWHVGSKIDVAAADLQEEMEEE